MSKSPRPKIRNPQFDLRQVPEDWAAGRPVLTHFLNAFHVIIPDGERFFVRTLKGFLNQIEDPQLRQDIRAFAGQEGMHAAAHEAMWETLRAQGQGVDAFRAVFQKIGVEMLEQRLGGSLAPETRLAIVAALEHYTAALSVVFFDPDFPTADFPDAMNELHKWHAAEEFEHRAVAFDILQQIDSGYGVRLAGFLTATALIAGFAALGTAMFVAHDPKGWSWKRLARPQGNAPFTPKMVFNVTRHLLTYLSPQFDPRDMEEPEGVTPFLARYS